MKVDLIKFANGLDVEYKERGTLSRMTLGEKNKDSLSKRQKLISLKRRNTFALPQQSCPFLVLPFSDVTWEMATPL